MAKIKNKQSKKVLRKVNSEESTIKEEEQGSQIKKEKRFSCPRCSSLFSFKKMEKVNHPSGALLDVCQKCRELRMLLQ